MRIRYEKDSNPSLAVHQIDIPIGTVFTCSAYSLAGERDVYLRIFTGIVSLTNPGKTWSGGANPTIHGYRVLDAEVVIHN